MITWLAVFPMVAIGLTVLTPFTAAWAPVLRIFVLTLVVVPLAVYLVVPWLLNLYADSWPRAGSPDHRGASRSLEIDPPR